MTVRMDVNLLNRERQREKKMNFLLIFCNDFARAGSYRMFSEVLLPKKKKRKKKAGDG